MVIKCKKIYAERLVWMHGDNQYWTCENIVVKPCDMNIYLEIYNSTGNSKNYIGMAPIDGRKIKVHSHLEAEDAIYEVGEFDDNDEVMLDTDAIATLYRFPLLLEDRGMYDSTRGVSDIEFEQITAQIDRSITRIDYCESLKSKNGGKTN